MNRLIFFAAALFLAVSSLSISSHAVSPLRAGEPIERAFISFRISGAVWEDEARFNSLLELLDRYPGVADEITFFTEQTHTPPTVERFEARLAIIKERIAEAKKRGYRSGINILCTIGHHPEALPMMIGPEYPRAMTIDGRTMGGTLCMNSEIFRERVRHIYSVMADADPDYIWIDDDVRLGHWLNSAGEAGEMCYCDTCMKGMSEVFGEEMTREKLAPKMSDYAARQKVHRFNADSINRLFALIEETVHAKNPNLPLGFMTGERYVEGYDFARWAETLSGPGKAPVWWRPGGGFYTQDDIGGMTRKAHDIGRQVSLLPKSVRVIESEIENFPYAPLQKSRHITALEAATHLAAGCTGAAFNVVTMNHEPVADYEPLIAELSRWRPFYDAMAKHLGRDDIVGVHPLWERTDADNPLGNPINWLFPPLADIGLPIAYAKGKSPVFLLARNYLAVKTPDEVRPLFAEGIYTDNDALGLLNDPNSLNLIKLTGLEWEKTITVDAIEKYTDDPLNGEFAGIDRDQRQSFWRDPAYGLRRVDPKARALSSIIDYAGNQTADCSMAVFENSLGGRFCVNGYHPWNYFQSRPKSTQIKRVMRWLSKDRLCAWVDSFERGNLWVRADDAGEVTAAAFLNATYDAAQNPALMIRTEREKLLFLDRSMKPVEVKASAVDGPYRRFVLPPVGPWEIALIKLL